MSVAFDSCSGNGAEVHFDPNAASNPMPTDHESRVRELQEKAYRAVLVCFLQEEFDLSKEMCLAELRKALNINDEKAEELMESAMQGEAQSVRTELTSDVISKLQEVSESLDNSGGPVEESASNMLTDIMALASPSIKQT
ncbi:hypothetical protein BSKO_04348 [Bryopsis sp. KO-2023]|nr:hypothetical protein BSKO_04348 [Bryopsis sp. KO-2023]